MNTFASLFTESLFEASALTPFLAEAMKKRQEQSKEKLTNAAVRLLDHVSANRQHKLAKLRHIRKMEKEAAKNMAEFEKAAKYFEHTGNFGPLCNFLPMQTSQSICAELGVAMPEDDDKKVPENWAPPT